MANTTQLTVTAVSGLIGAAGAWLVERFRQNRQDQRDRTAREDSAQRERASATNRMLELGIVPANLIFERLETTEHRLDTAEHELVEARATIMELRTQMAFQIQELAKKDAIIAEKDRRINELLAELARERSRSAMLEGMLANRSLTEPVPLPKPPAQDVA